MTSCSAPEPTDSGELPLDRQSGVTDMAGEAMTTCSFSEPTEAGEQPLDRQREVTETDEEREAMTSRSSRSPEPTDYSNAGEAMIRK